MITFLTRIPVKYPYEYRDEDFIKGITFMPLIGLLIGIILWGISFSSYNIDKTVVSLLIWTVYIWVTGALHFDGLADTVDGIFSNRDRGRMLEIMKDSRIGAFGVLSIFFVLSFNIVLTNHIEYKLLLLLPVVGRSCAVLACSLSTYVREEGIGKGFIENSGLKEGIISVVYLIVLGILINYKLLLSIMFILAFTFYMTRYFKKKLGGITGDSIGFFIEITQTLFIFITYIMRGVLS